MPARLHQIHPRLLRGGTATSRACWRMIYHIPLLFIISLRLSAVMRKTISIWDGKLARMLTASYLRRVVDNAENSFVFSSSLAVYGGTLPEYASPIPPHHAALSSYGAEGRLNCWSATIPAKAVMGWAGCVCRRSVFARVNQTALLLCQRVIREPLPGQTTVCGIGKFAAVVLARRR